MTTAKPKMAIQITDSELAVLVSQLSNEALGVALRIMDMQARTDTGLIDAKNTHNQIGVSKRHWPVLREELLRVLTIEDGFIVYKPTLTRKVKKEENMRAAAITRHQERTRKSFAGLLSADEPPALEHTPSRDTQNEAAPRSTNVRPIANSNLAINPDATSPISPFVVQDRTEPALPPRTPGHAPTLKRGGRQQLLPGFAANHAVAMGLADELPSPKAACYDNGVILLVRLNGMTEKEARARIGKLLTQWDAPYVYAAIMDAIGNKDKISNPAGWIGNRLKDFPDKATAKAARLDKAMGKKSPNPAAAKVKPKATASFMQISPEKAARLERLAAKVNAGQAPEARAATTDIGKDPGQGAETSSQTAHPTTTEQISRVSAY